MRLFTNIFTLVLSLVIASVTLPSAFAQDDLRSPADDGTAPSPSADRDPVTVSGIMQSFTFATDGKVTGFLLDDNGVRFPSRLGREIAAIASRGARLKVRGQRRSEPDGDVFLDAGTITNLDTGVALTIGMPQKPIGSATSPPASGLPMAPVDDIDADALPKEPPTIEDASPALPPLPPTGGAIILPNEL